jgi:DNA-binding LacI/PurR family transcriptional regulator
MQMGEIAARLMLDRISGRERAIQHVTLEPSFVLRGSVGAPRPAV